MGAVINFHILTGYNYKKGLTGSNYKEYRQKVGYEKNRGSVNIKTADAVNTAFDLNGDVASGLYMVNITAGDKTYAERLVIQK